MKNHRIPIEGAPTHLDVRTAESLALRPFEGKVPAPAYVERKAWFLNGPPGARKSTLAWALYNDRRFIAEHAFTGTVYVSADEHGAGDSIPAYREGVAGADPATRHRLWKKFQNDADYIRSRTLDIAIGEGFSVFIDTTGSGARARQTMRILKDEGYHVRLVSCYAPLPVCVAGVLGRERQADPAYLLTRRIAALETFNDLAGMADTVSLRFSAAVQSGPAEILYLGSERSALPGMKRKVVSADRAALGRILHALRQEGTEASVAPLRALMAVTDADREALHQAGRAMAVFISRWAGSAARLVPVPNHV